jgi:hypothetical protein
MLCQSLYTHLHACLHICMYVCMYVCMYTCTCTCSPIIDIRICMYVRRACVRIHRCIGSSLVKQESIGSYQDAGKGLILYLCLGGSFLTVSRIQEHFVYIITYHVIDIGPILDSQSGFIFLLRRILSIARHNSQEQQSSRSR